MLDDLLARVEALQELIRQNGANIQDSLDDAFALQTDLLTQEIYDEIEGAEDEL